MLSWFWRRIPRSIRINLFTALIVIDSRGDHVKGLKQLLKIKDKLDLVINERATAYGKGIHPKHRLTNYHQFFIDRIKEGERVLDVGCGCGAVAQSIAKALPSCVVTGIDHDQGRLSQAKSGNLPRNLIFLEGDATKDLPSQSWDVVVLSNVLEHISNRIGFLKDLKSSLNARSYLIRLPLFERDWQMSLRSDLGVDYRSDPDHKIEHKLEEFHQEIKAAGLKAVELKTLWGEIWADCRPIANK